VNNPPTKTLPLPYRVKGYFGLGCIKPFPPLASALSGNRLEKRRRSGVAVRQASAVALEVSGEQAQAVAVRRRQAVSLKKKVKN